jgi:hypothetical protein
MPEAVTAARALRPVRPSFEFFEGFFEESWAGCPDKHSTGQQQSVAVEDNAE